MYVFVQSFLLGIRRVWSETPVKQLGVPQAVGSKSSVRVFLLDVYNVILRVIKSSR